MFKGCLDKGTAHTSVISQYLDIILAATWSEDGAIHDVCKALAPHFREPNAIVCISWTHSRVYSD